MDNIELLEDVVTESLEHVEQMESLLLVLEENPEHADPDVINNIFRSAHSIKGVTSFVGLNKIKDLSHAYENVLNAIRKDVIKPTPNLIDVLLQATDFLKALLQNADQSETCDISGHLEALNQLLEGDGGQTQAPGTGEPQKPVRAIEEVGDQEPGRKASGGKRAKTDKEAEAKNVKKKKTRKVKKAGAPSTPKPPVPANRPTVTLESEDVLSIVDSTDLFVFHVSRSGFEASQAKGLSTYILRIDVFRDLQSQGRDPKDLINHLKSIGEITSASFDLETMVNQPLEDLPQDAILGLLFTTLIEPGLIEGAVNLPLDGVEMVEWGDENHRRKLDKGREDIPAADASGPEPAPSGAEESQPVFSEPVTNTEAETIEAVKTLQVETSLRVHVSLLDRLMNLAGELVLGRNQLMQAVDASSAQTLMPIAQRIDLITSELQAQVMQTRMQPLAKVFNKFSRLVRDLARNLGKQVELEIEGQEVELDKTIIEGLSDPLVHLVRNSLDHGIEKTEVREAAGKNPIGRVAVRAYHEAGQVNIEIVDDGAGMDPEKIKAKAIQVGIITEADAQKMSDQRALDLIFNAGFSTAERVSEVSGRGVGMDVVRSALEKLGGTVDLNSVKGQGTTVRIKLPLTMAILPCLIVRVASERYAIPQISLIELVRVRMADIKTRIEKVGGAEVLRLRNNLLPLIRLADILKVDGQYRDALSNELKEDRRKELADRRSDGEQSRGEINERSGLDRRSLSALNILVLAAGDLEYGLIVDELEDTEEIVVKPLGRHIKEIQIYAGATIMGDGRVAPIVDVSGLALEADIFARNKKAKEFASARAEKMGFMGEKDVDKILLFNYAPNELFAVPISLVARIERVAKDQVESVLGRHSIQYRGRSLRLIMLDKHLPVGPLPDQNKIFIIIFNIGGQEIGIAASNLVDEKLVPFKLDVHAHRHAGVMGSMVIDAHTVMVLEVFELVDLEDPEWMGKDVSRMVRKDDQGKPQVLLVEDSEFFRDKITRLLESIDCQVYQAENGRMGLEMLKERYPMDLVITDIEMPVMNGYDMVREIRANPQFEGLKIIACSSHAGDQDIEEGFKAGVDRYMVKLDRDKLTAAISDVIRLNGKNI